jgi:signal transduction histidine kinase
MAKIQSIFLTSKIARRLFLLFISCAMVPTVLLATLSFTLVTRQLHQQSQRQLHQASKTMATIISERLDSLEGEMRKVAFIFQSGPETMTQGMGTTYARRLSDRFNALVLITPAGNPSPIFGEIQNPPIFSEPQEEHIKSGKTLLTTWYLTEPRRIYMCRLLDLRKPQRGKLLAEINASYLWAANEGNPLLLTTELCVFDDQNNTLFSSLKGPLSLRPPSESDMTTNIEGQCEWEYANTPYIATYRSIYLKPRFNTPKWTLVLSEPKANVLAPIALFKTVFPLVVLLSLLVVVLLTVIQVRRNLQPITILREATAKIAEGDHDNEVTIRTGDEFETLAHAFNQMNKKIKQTQSLLVQTAKMATMGQMAAGIVHEINQPLTSIYGHLQLAFMQEQQGEQRKLLETLIRAADNLTQIVSRFRSFSRRSDDQMKPISVNQVIDEVRTLLDHQIKKNGVKCIIEKDEDLPTVIGDQTNLKQVFTNLIVNAVQALEEHERNDAFVKIKTYRHNSEICVDVEDNGPGIPKENQSCIFDPFFTTKTADKGTGLGLAITQSILHHHGATIHVESREGTGTRFIVSFPISSDGSHDLAHG